MSSKLTVTAAFLVVWLGSVSGAAAAPGVECVLVEDGLVELDGLVDDWEGIESTRYGVGDGAFAARCAQTDREAFFLIEVADADVLRTGGARKASQDQLTMHVGANDRWSKLLVLPGTRGFEPVFRWNGRPLGKGVRALDSLQDRGWAVEVAVPLSRLANWGPSTGALRLRIDYRDRDGGGARVVTGRGALFFAGAVDAYESFRKQVGLGRPAIDRLVDLDGEPGVERLVVGKAFVGVLSNTYGYVQLPVASPDDVLDVKVVDLGGRGRASVITHVRQRGGGGSRDLVALWTATSAGTIQRMMAFEVRKAAQGNSIDNTWELVPRRSKGKRGRRGAGGGFDIVHRAGTATGWNGDNFVEVPATDARSILLPWGEQTSRVYHVEDGAAFGGEAAE